jgi:hypothetical protein
VTTLPEPIDPRNLRIGDAEREVAAERLRVAAGEGRLDIDELEERITAVYQAKTYAELEPVTRDLPVSSGTGAYVAPSPERRPGRWRIGSKPGRTKTIVWMGGSENKGTWVVPRKYLALAWMGGIVLDLREAEFEANEVVITACAWMAGIEIIVPEGLNVQVHGLGFMGGYQGPAGTEVDPDSPTVHVKGFAFMAGVDVKRRGPKKDKKSKGLDGGGQAELSS